MKDLQIRFLAQTEISPAADLQINALDQLAFTGEDVADPQLKDIQWASHEWMAVGYLDQQLVVQFCLLTREIRVGVQRLMVAGVGGVATHPEWRRKGLARQLLLAGEVFMRQCLMVPFGLLICAEETQPLYAECGWLTVAQSLFFNQEGQQRFMETVVMILPLSRQTWPVGEIDLEGQPW